MRRAPITEGSLCRLGVSDALISSDVTPRPAMPGWTVAKAIMAVPASWLSVEEGSYQPAFASGFTLFNALRMSERFAEVPIPL